MPRPSVRRLCAALSTTALAAAPVAVTAPAHATPGNDDFQTVGGGVDTLNGESGTDRAHRDSTDKVTSVEKRY